MNPFNLIAQFHNWLADKDFVWWPFSFLRPAPQTPLTFKDTGLMTLCFGGLSFLMFTVFAVINNALTLDSAGSIFLVCFLGFGAWFNIVTKPLWNLRARSLSKK